LECNKVYRKGDEKLGK